MGPSEESLLGETQIESPPNSTSSTAINMKLLSDMLNQKLRISIMADIEDKISSCKTLKTELKMDINKLKEEQDTMNNNIISMNAQISKLEKEKNYLHDQIQQLSQTKIPAQQNFPDGNETIVLYGLNENYNEDADNLQVRILKIFHELYNVDLQGYIEDLSRLGNRGYHRPVKIELLSRSITKYLCENSINLKNTGLYISEYLDTETLKERLQLKKLLILARKNGQHAVIRNNKLIIDGRRANQQLGGRSRTIGGPLPDISDHEAMQRFFLQQIQLGEELLAAGDLEAGVEHLGQAVAVCGQTQQLLGVLQQTMPAPIFHLLLKKLPEVSERLRASMKAGGSAMQEEDVE